MIRGLSVVIASACICVGCSREAPVSTQATVDLDAEKAAVLKRDQEWHAAVESKQDAAYIASFFTSDGIMFGSGQATSVGRAALTETVQALLSGPDFHDDWKWTRVELSADGRLAWLVGNTNITINDAAGRPVTTSARLLNVWRKEADGVWRCAVDVWVDEPAAASN
jgi:ketosteroid isomerase-like protein